MAGQVRKIENPETLPKEPFQVATFENIIPIFLEFKVFEKFAKNENRAFCLIKYAKNIWKIDKVLGIRIQTIDKTRTRGKLGIRALLFFYLTIGSLKFFKHFEGFRRLSNYCYIRHLAKWQKLRNFTNFKYILVCPMQSQDYYCAEVYRFYYNNTQKKSGQSHITACLASLKIVTFMDMAA